MATVRELLDEADRLLGPGGIVASQVRDELKSARDAFEGVDPATVDLADQRVARLQAAIASASQPIPEAESPSGSAAVPPAGRDAGSYYPSPRSTYALVVLSLLFMYFVACMTIVHNRGVALLAEVQSVAEKNANRRFGELERQILGAQRAIKSKADSCTGKDGCWAGLVAESAASYLLVDELRSLDTQLFTLGTRVTAFYDEVYSPAPGMDGATAVLLAPVTTLGSLVGRAVAVPAPNMLLPQSQSSLEKDCARIRLQDRYQGKTQETPGEHTAAVGGTDGTSGTGAPKAVRKVAARTIPKIDGDATAWPVVLGLEVRDVVLQACDLNVRHISSTLPSVDEWIVRLREMTTNYSLWLLPGLYAALGSLIYLMRLTFDAKEPNPPLYRVINRVALAALAGIAVGWFWQGSTADDVEAQAIGAGLFTVGFVVGYSIEIFFTLLDRASEALSTVIRDAGKPKDGSGQASNTG